MIIKKFENFSPYDDEPLSRAEQHFGKQTRLEKQFSEIMVSNLSNNDRATSILWSALNAIKIEMRNIISNEDILFKELMYRIVEGEDEIVVFSDICSRLPYQTEEIKRLLKSYC